MKRIIFGIALVTTAVAIHFSGLGEKFADPQRLRELILGAGSLGYLAFLVLFTFIAPLGLPGFIFIITASLVWPLPVAFALSMAGGVGSGIFGFWFARYIARDWVGRHLPARFHRFDERLAEHSVRTVALVYLVFFLAPPTHWVLGLSRIRFLPFIAGCVIGILPGTLALSFLGGNLVDAFRHYPWIAWPTLLLLGLILLWLGALRPPKADATTANVKPPAHE